MVEFSSVAMRILSPDGKTVLAELQTIDRTNVATARRAGDVTTQNIQQVQKAAATSARQIAGNVAQIASMGTASAESLRGIVSQGANIAFMFGTGGAIAGAIGLTGLAIVNLFTRTRREIEETSRKAQEELRTLTQAGDLGRIGGRFGVATQLFSGDPLAVRGEDERERAFEARQIGIQGVRARMAQLQAIVDRNMGGGGLAQSARQNALNAMHEWQRELDKLVPRYERLLALQKEFEDQEGFRAQKNVEALRDASQATRDKVISGQGGLPITRALGFDPSGIGDMPGFAKGMLDGIQEALRKVPPLPPIKITPELERIANVDALAAGLAATFGQSLVQGITDGITAAVSGGGLVGGFEALTGAVLVGLGHMAIRIGTESVAFLTLMETIKNAIANFLPEFGLGAAFGLIGLGGLLIAAGGALGGRSRGGFGGGASVGGGFSSAPSQIIDRGLVNPLNGVVNAPGQIVARPAINVSAIVYGSPEDAKWQRFFLETSDRAVARRGA